jgi:hypothetical protein
MAASVRNNLNEEVNILKDELHELSTFAAAEKQEMTDELHRLTGKMKHLFAAAAAEKQAMQLKLDVTNARNERLAKEAQHALIELDSLTDKCALNCQVYSSDPRYIQFSPCLTENINVPQFVTEKSMCPQILELSVSWIASVCTFHNGQMMGSHRFLNLVCVIHSGLVLQREILATSHTRLQSINAMYMYSGILLT